MKNLNQYFRKLKFSRFLTISAVLIYISDILNIFYVNLHFLPERLTMASMRVYIEKALVAKGLNPASIDMYMVQEMRQVMINVLSNVFYFFLFYHGFVYFFYNKNKKWPKKYVYGYALTGAILTIIELPFLAQRHLGWTFAMVITTLIYLYVWFGLRYYKKNGELG